MKHSKPKGKETEREFETVRHKLGLELYCGIKVIKLGFIVEIRLRIIFIFLVF